MCTIIIAMHIPIPILELGDLPLMVQSRFQIVLRHEQAPIEKKWEKMDSPITIQRKK